MNIWRLGIEIGCSSFVQLKSRKVVAQGWPYTGNMAFLQNNKNASNWLQKLVPGDEKAQRTLANLLVEMQPGDIVLGFEGNTIKGICEMPSQYVYLYRSHHKTCCSYNNPTKRRYCDYANCLYPVIWVDWQIFENHCASANIDLPTPNAGQGVKGIEQCHKHSNEIKTAWDAYNLNPC